MKRRNPFPGAAILDDPRDGKRIRLRKTIKGRKIGTYLPGPWASGAMVAAYDAAVTGTPPAPQKNAASGTFDHTITHYLSSKESGDLQESTRYHKRLRLAWIRGKIGSARLASLEPRHVEAMMDMTGGATAGNLLHKEPAELYAFARKRPRFKGMPPTDEVDKRNAKQGGFHTCSPEQVQQFRDHHPSGTLARLALELIVGTGAARAGARAMGRQNIKATDI